MNAPRHIVLTLHSPGGFPSRKLLEQAQTLPVESMSAGFSQLVLVFPLIALDAARRFATDADSLRTSDTAYRHLQVGVAHGVLPQPLPRPMQSEHPVVIEAFKTGLSAGRFSEEFTTIENIVA
jgi:hypothetical protein